MHVMNLNANHTQVETKAGTVKKNSEAFKIL